jgi:hypothetical protein
MCYIFLIILVIHKNRSWKSSKTYFVSIINLSRLTLNNNFLAFYDVDSSRKVAE